MHVGHLRSTIIGESICRALELVGTETIRWVFFLLQKLSVSPSIFS
jgi:arginyl-tRNA synthetase